MSRAASIILALIFFAPQIFFGDEIKPGEKEKIEALFQAVEKSDGLIFIRNGTEWPKEAAVIHMRGKLKDAGEKIQTVEDFIEQCASKSSKTGEAYQIKTTDGKIQPSADWLREQLKKIK